MVLKDGASLDHVMQYVGHLVKIANMGQRFHWKSVVKYGYEYRKAQAESNFVWGADNVFMMQVSLRERTNVNTPSSRHDFAKVCSRFNSTRECQWKYCKYVHSCKICNSSSHGGANHNSKHDSQEPRTTSIQPPKNLV